MDLDAGNLQLESRTDEEWRDGDRGLSPRVVEIVLAVSVDYARVDGVDVSACVGFALSRQGASSVALERSKERQREGLGVGFVR